MSDMANQYHLAWVSVFDDSPRKLACTWHADRAWRGGLQQHVKGVEKQAAVYSQLRVLLEELAVDKSTLIGKLLIIIFNEPIAVKHICIYTLIGTHNHFTSMYTIKGSDSTKCRREFGEYFQKYYTKCPEEWASCHRQVKTQGVL